MKIHDRVRAVTLLVVLLGLSAGCAKTNEAPVKFAASKDVSELDSKVQDQIAQLLTKHCGKPGQMRMLGDAEISLAHLERGAKVYARHCQSCHGGSGDGLGPAAKYLDPKPRDFRRGTFKFVSTDYGSKPLRQDLVRTIRAGATGSSMPSFDILPVPEIDAVVDYVMAITHRGELESRLAYEAQQGDIDDDVVKQAIEYILNQWREAETKLVAPLTPAPVFTLAHVDAGRKAFVEQGCVKCHGEDGRGNVAGNAGLTDEWGNSTRAADLTSGMLRGGQKPLEIYRKVVGGINGTPMPSFRAQLQAKPEQAWDLTAYVMHLTNARRQGFVPEAAVLKP